MCSVLGYVGNQAARELILDGLARLEYRGYDSAGFACISSVDASVLYAKSSGQLSNLIDHLKSHPIDGSLAIGHTRWATHGGFASENAHPHFDCNKRIALMHNGIIENYYALKQQLIAAGHIFHSETDTEVVCHLLEQAFAHYGMNQHALQSVAGQLQGAYAIVAFSQDSPDRLFVMRRSSPLCIGIGSDEYFVASDPFAFSSHTNNVLFIPDNAVGFVGRGEGALLYNQDGDSVSVVPTQIDIARAMQTKGNFEHFMLKEIAEQPQVIHETLHYLKAIDQECSLASVLQCTESFFKDIERIHFVACGTSAHASSIAAHFFEEIAGIEATVSLASELRYKKFFPHHRCLYIAVSQSGETADTLEAIRMIKRTGVQLICVSNVASSTLVREIGGHILTKAGQEVAVASTKAFSTQMITLYWLAHALAYERSAITRTDYDAVYQAISSATIAMRSSAERYESQISSQLAERYAQSKHMIFLGRHVSYPFAQEATLKLQEITYIMAQCYPTGELKHGPLALIDTNMVVILFSCQDQMLYQKIISSAQEVKARGAHLVIYAFEGQEELLALADTSFVFPHVAPLLEPLVMTHVMQTFVAQIALQLGRPLDKPRNLAKSVTVE